MYKVITELLAMVHGITMFVWTLKKGLKHLNLKNQMETNQTQRI